MEEGESEQARTLADELRAKVRLAAEVAKSAPDFQEHAFNKVLDYLLQEGGGAVGVPRKGIGRATRSSGKLPISSPNSLERIKPILGAPAELVNEHSEIYSLEARGKIYKLLALARDKFQIDGLTTAELRAIANQKFRLGILDGTLRGTLSKAPPQEVGRETTETGDTLYKLFQPGVTYLEEQISKIRARNALQADASGPRDLVA